MAITVKDLDKQEAWSTNAMLPVGWHEVTVKTSAEGESSGGYPQIELEMEAPLGTIRDWIVVTEATRGKVVQLLEAVGIEIQGGEWDISVGAIAGKKVGIKVGEEPSFNDPSTLRKKVQAYVPVENLPKDRNIQEDAGPSNEGSSDSDLPF